MTTHETNEEVQINGEWLWQLDQNEKTLDVFNVPNKTYLLFGIFVLDIFVKDTEPILQSCYDKLTYHIQQWNKSYPWSEFHGISLRFDTTTREGRKYILGQLCVEDNLEQEETFIVTLLRSWSGKMGDQVFIKIVDTDGDFLLANCHDSTIKEYEYPIGNNRLWLQNGTFIIIPSTIHPKRGLSPGECFDILLKSPYQCINMGNLSQSFDKLYNLNDFPNNQLNKLGVITIDLPQGGESDWIKTHPQIINFLIKNLYSISITEDQIHTIRQREYTQPNNYQSIKFLISKNHFDLLLLFLKMNNLKTDMTCVSKKCGDILVKCLQELQMGNMAPTINLEPTSSIDDLDKDTLLDPPNIFETYKFDDLDFKQDYEPEENIDTDDKLMNLFSQFIDSNGERSKHANQENQTTIDEDDDDDEDEEERKAKEYLQQENSGIDEDDFFEFFLKEALNMKDNDIDQMIKPTEINKNQEDESNNEEMDEFDDLFQDMRSKEDISNAFKEMFKSLTIDGATNSPLESLLRNLGDNDDVD